MSRKRTILPRAAIATALLAACSIGPLRAEAVFELGDAAVPPGATGQSLPLIVDADDEPDPIVGWSVVIQYDPRALGSVSLESAREADFVIHKRQDEMVDPGMVLMALIYGMPFDRPERNITSSNDGVIAELRFCVLEDAPPGTHAVEFAAIGTPHRGQPQRNVYTADGRSRVPVVVAGSVTVTGDPVSGGECPADVHEFIPPPEPPRPPPGFVLEGTFSLADRTVVRGGRVSVPLTVHASWEVRGYSFSIDFDEEVLEAAAIEEVFRREDGEDFDFALYDFDNDRDTPGNAGIDEGYLVGAVVFSHFDNFIAVPRETDVEMLEFEFFARPDAPAGSTRIEFVDGAEFTWGSQPVPNVMTVHNESVDPTEAGAFVFIPAVLEVLPDIQIFVRGDASGDGEVNIADPQRTLNFLFLSGPPPACYDAADSNDDGVINVSDPQHTLNYLFLGGSAPPSPFFEAGIDPTADPLGCLVRGTHP